MNTANGVEIIPAMLPTSYDDLVEHLERINGLVRTVQIDLVDGHFAPTTTWPYSDVESFKPIVAQEEGMPFWEDFDFEVDLMVEESKSAALDWVRAGATRIVVHIESPDDRGALTALQEFREGAGAVEVGLAISLDTPIEKLDTLAHLGSCIQVMGIAAIGKQGEPFDERAVSRVREVREKFPSHIISVDGGVSEQNAPALIKAGATRLVMGSAIFEGDARENYRELRSIVGSV